MVFEKAARKKAGNVSEGGGAPAPWNGNIRGPSAAFSKKPKKVRSWVDGARAANNPLLVEGTFRTGTQQHACLEPHAAVARFDGDRLTVHVSTQAVFHVMELIAKRYKLAPRQGARDCRPCRRRLRFEGQPRRRNHRRDRTRARSQGAGQGRLSTAHEELSVTGYRPATEVKIALLPSEQGELKALSLTAYADTGAATNSTIAALARLIYPAEAKELADFDVISNLPPGAPFRGPGGPPMAFALEQAIDEAALRMNVDPIALRKRWDPDPNRQRLYDWAAGLDVWRNRKPVAAQSGRYRRGVGIATGYWLYLWQPGSKVELAVKDGRIVASTRDAGHRHRHAQRASPTRSRRNSGWSRRRSRSGSATPNLPEGPGSGGSRVTASVVPPTLLAIEQLKASIAAARQAAADPRARTRRGAS